MEDSTALLEWQAGNAHITLDQSDEYAASELHEFASRILYTLHSNYCTKLRLQALEIIKGYFPGPVGARRYCREDLHEIGTHMIQDACDSDSMKLRLQAACLVAINNRSEETSQAAIARKYGLTRAALSRRLRDMRQGLFLKGLRNFHFGGNPELAEKSRVRAIRVHNYSKQNKELCKTTIKPSPFHLARKLA